MEQQEEKERRPNLWAVEMSAENGYRLDSVRKALYRSRAKADKRVVALFAEGQRRGHPFTINLVPLMYNQTTGMHDVVTEKSVTYVWPEAGPRGVHPTGG